MSETMSITYNISIILVFSALVQASLVLSNAHFVSYYYVLVLKIKPVHIYSESKWIGDILRMQWNNQLESKEINKHRGC